MSQKPANLRETGASVSATRGYSSAEKAGDKTASNRRLAPTDKIQSEQASPVAKNTPAAVKGAVSSQRPQNVARSTLGPVRAVAANDDVPSIGGLIFALQQRPSKSPFYIALAASGVWFVLGCLIAWAVIARGVEGDSSFSTLLSTPSIIAVIATIIS